MENSDIKEAFVQLNKYLDFAPDMFVSVDEGQFLKLETKYRHLLLRYSNDYRTLTSLKLIEQSIPQIILKHPKVVAQLKGIQQIKGKISIEREKHQQLINKERSQGEIEANLSEDLITKKRHLILQKRKYMKLRRDIDLQSAQEKPKVFKKYIFSSQLESQKPIDKAARRELNELQLLTTFKRGIKDLEKKSFQTSGRNINVVLQNLKIKRNISSVFEKKRFRDQQQVAKSWELRLTSTKSSERNTNPNPIFRGSGCEQFQTKQQLPSELQSLSSLELYSRICQNKLKLSVFTSTLNNLLCKRQE